MMTRGFRTFLLAALAGSMVSTVALAQPFCGVRNHIRLAHGVCNTEGESETRIDTEFVVAGPVMTPASATRTNNCGSSSSMSFVMTSDYGTLSYAGSGTGTSGCCGVFLWADEFIGGEPKAQFFDRITIQSASLPAGTPVTLRATLTVAGGVSASNASTEKSFGGELSIFSSTMSLSNQAGVVVAEGPATVGQTRDISARLRSTLRDYQLLGFNSSGSISADVTVRVVIESLTPGVTITSCSGHNYTQASCDSIDFNRNGVFPEDQDVIDFFNVLAGGECATCNDIDFNNNTVFPEDQDVIDFFTVLAGGNCP